MASSPSDLVDLYVSSCKNIHLAELGGEYNYSGGTDLDWLTFLVVGAYCSDILTSAQFAAARRIKMRGRGEEACANDIERPLARQTRRTM